MPSEPRHTIAGDSMAAHGWVEASALPEETKVSLHRFIARFPTLTFYKNDAADLDAEEEERRVTFPRWLRAICQTMRSIEPGQFVWARFDASIHPFLNGDELRDNWYSIGPFGYFSQERPMLESMADLQLLPIGEDEVAGGLSFAINLADHTDQRVYEYVLENLQHNKSSGTPLDRSVYPMFASYAGMFGQIVGLKLEAEDGTTRIVDAQNVIED